MLLKKSFYLNSHINGIFPLSSHCKKLRTRQKNKAGSTAYSGRSISMICLCTTLGHPSSHKMMTGTEFNTQERSKHCDLMR